MDKNIRHRLFILAAQNKIPLTGAFELTPMCNLKCKMCYIRKDASEVKKLGGIKPLEFWLDIARQAKEAGTLSPLLTGGETFTYPYLKELYTAMYHMGMEISINSNGTCISEEIVSWLREMPPTRINITLYGASNETYGKLCGDYKGFDKMKRGVELLQKNNIRFKFNCSLMPENAMDLEAMIDFAKKYKSGLRLATYMVPPTRSMGKHSEDFNDRLTAQECAYYQVLGDWLQATPEQFLKTTYHASKFQELTPELIAEAKAKPPRKMGCLAGRSSFWVDWQGNFSGCGMMDYPKISLNDHSFAEAWHEIVEWTNNMRYSSACTNCINFGVCHSCAAMVYNENGNFEDRPEYLCEKAKYCSIYYQEFAKKLPKELVESFIPDNKESIDDCIFDENE
ncbi:MAG: radical SAM protein [Erysipelotrichaceae bacterium]|nr:radical SAM protein [Erysipelotrichaceae bacterium]